MKTIIPLDNLFDDQRGESEDDFKKRGENYLLEKHNSELTKAVEELLEESKEEKEKDDKKTNQ